MKILSSTILSIAIIQVCYGVPLHIQKRAAFYIANETACVVDNIVYSNGDPIPTDDPCESCKCRPPGFACVLKDCEVKPGCRAVRRSGHCCPEYICGCEHNGRMYRDGDEIRDTQNPCYTCHCQGSSIACAFVDCLFRVDCAPEYIPGECCPKYEKCNDTVNVPFDGGNPDVKDKESNLESTVTSDLITASKVEYVEDTSKKTDTVSTPVVEVFESETKSPELLQLDPEAIRIPTVTVNETTSSTENADELNTSPHIAENIEHHSESQESPEIRNHPELPTDESSLKEESKNQDINDKKSSTQEGEPSLPTTLTLSHYITDEVKSALKVSTEISLQPEEPSTELPVKPEESSTENSLHSEDIDNPVVIEHTDVEAEEPSNTLESDNSASDYGKSLKFPDQDEAKSEETEKLQETTLPEISTSSPIALREVIASEVPKEEEIQDSSNHSTESEVLVKDLYYKANESADLVETVTTIIHFKEETPSSAIDEATPLVTDKGNVLHYADSKLTEEETINTSASSMSSSEELNDKQDATVGLLNKEEFTTNKDTLEHLEENQGVDNSESSVTEPQEDSTTKNVE